MKPSYDAPRTVAFALCGSFCSFSAVLPQVGALRRRGWAVLPILRRQRGRAGTRFGTAERCAAPCAS